MAQEQSKHNTKLNGLIMAYLFILFIYPVIY